MLLAGQKNATVYAIIDKQKIDTIYSSFLLLP